MKSNVGSIIIAVFLVLASIYNLGAGLAQFGKGGLVSGSMSALASVGESMTELNRNNQYTQGLPDNSQSLRTAGAISSTLMYLIAVGIICTAVAQLVSSIGVFTRSVWVSRMLMIAGIAGILVEIQDVFEDGLGIGQIAFIAVSVAAIYLSIQLKRSVGSSTTKADGLPAG